MFFLAVTIGFHTFFIWWICTLITILVVNMSIISGKKLLLLFSWLTVTWMGNTMILMLTRVQSAESAERAFTRGRISDGPQMPLFNDILKRVETHQRRQWTTSIAGECHGPWHVTCLCLHVEPLFDRQVVETS